jgi:polyhydroxyalkanoate synthesis regulator phasin
MKMRELVINSVLAGIGLASLTREKAERVAAELVKRGDIRHEEAKEFVDHLAARGDEERRALRKIIGEEIERVMNELHLATGKDIDTLGKKIEALSQSLDK